MKSRLNEAMPVYSPAHEHHPTGRCNECILWSHYHEKNPNFGVCLVTLEAANSEWSCKLFTPIQPFL